ncbi:MAG TPA: bifunctional [glutamate--ammonia ligase]-adenylyl-L-tyrosine phosphorylase/[glutamate--ammonia-ligase] adenylyltransferase [Desulfobacteraceae bacterium]|nr:bifunctional [glutamate--ammonia ligase]-adenylyl-L-tyrosine phosphorylase/[glutamate--ammonia-ligase] adenylyltransferase [Desulfobacteraceae bacterium]
MGLTGISNPLEQALIEKKAVVAETFAGKGLCLPRDPEFLENLDRALVFSDFIYTSVLKEPELFLDLVTSGDLDTSYAENRYGAQLDARLSGVSEISDMKRVLLQTRLREMVRIAWQDLTGKAGLEETLKDLSNLADACIDRAFLFLHDTLCSVYETPLDSLGEKQRIIVLGMGKLGAGELNFSSDVDLIFVCPDTPAPAGRGRGITNEEFFTKLCRRFLRVFDTAMDETTLFRVDTRLRPFGTSGPLVMSCSAMEDYYQCQGREWERYALIKARPVAGDIAGGKALLRALNPFIYRRYFDYGTFESFREMKKRIAFQTEDSRLKNNVKLGTGGIREVEFFCQIFQLVRGGVEPEFQEPNLVRVLSLLAARSCIDETVRAELEKGYCFLRRVEHRLQEHADLQTHDLPETSEERLRLALSMGFQGWEPFLQALDGHRTRIHTHFSQLLVTEESQDRELDQLRYLWAHLNNPQAEEVVLTVSGFDNPEQVVKLLKRVEEHPNTKKLTSDGTRRLDQLIPMLVKKAGETKAPETVLSRCIDLVISIERRICYLSLLLENPGVLSTLAALAEKSHWIVSFLASHPALLEELIDPSTLYTPPGKEALAEDLALRMAHIPHDDFEFQLEELCLFKQVNVLRVAAADISQNYPLMKVSDHLTWIAETILHCVIAISWDQTMVKYGTPVGKKTYEAACCGFAAIAYGKLGGIELGYNSDLDLVFLHTGRSGTTTSGSRAIEKKRFYTLLGQRIVSALTLHTPAGTLYQADMRLRPSGQAGAIVSQVDAFADYAENQAWIWEHQAIIRARPVAGDEDLQNRFSHIRRRVLTRFRNPESLKRAVGEMRERVRREQFKSLKHLFDLKQEPGGIVDIEFLVQFLVLKHGHDHPALVQWTDNVRLLDTLAGEGLLSQSHADTLKTAFLAFRRSLHRQDLQEETRRVPLEPFAAMKQEVFAIYDEMMTA